MDSTFVILNHSSKRDFSSVTGRVSENGDSIQVVPVTHMITLSTHPKETLAALLVGCPKMAIRQSTHPKRDISSVTG